MEEKIFNIQGKLVLSGQDLKILSVDNLQANKENKQPKDYYYGGKHTFAIPDDLFDKFKFVTSIRKETQSGKIIELIEKYLEENGDLVRVYYLTQKQGDKK